MSLSDILIVAGLALFLVATLAFLVLYFLSPREAKPKKAARKPKPAVKKVKVPSRPLINLEFKPTINLPRKEEPKKVEEKAAEPAKTEEKKSDHKPLGVRLVAAYVALCALVVMALLAFTQLNAANLAYQRGALGYGLEMLGQALLTTSFLLGIAFLSGRAMVR